MMDFATYASRGLRLDYRPGRERAYAMQVKRLRESFFGRVSRIFRNELMREYGEAVEAARGAIVPHQMPGLALSRINQVAAGIVDAFREAYRLVIPPFASDTYRSLTQRKALVKQVTDPDPGDTLDYWFRVADSYVEHEGASMVTAVIGSTIEEVRHYVNKWVRMGIEEGWSVQRIADSIYDDLEGVTKTRSIVIARTETIRASNYGTHMGARATGLPMDKEWITSLDGRERPSHNMAHGQIVGLNEYFIVGQSLAMYPLDPILPAHESVQCRCAMAHIVRETDLTEDF